MSEKIREEQIVYSAQEAAKILHSSPNYIYELVKKGKLKAVKLKSIKILKSTLEDFLKDAVGVVVGAIDKRRKISICEDIER